MALTVALLPYFFSSSSFSLAVDFLAGFSGVVPSGVPPSGAAPAPSAGVPGVASGFLLAFPSGALGGAASGPRVLLASFCWLSNARASLRFLTLSGSRRSRR